MVKTKIEFWESKERIKVNVKVDSSDIGWVTKTDFDYIFKRYKAQVATSIMLLLELGAFLVLYLLK